MSDCCNPTAYRRFFNSKEAARNVRSYRRNGLDPMASSMVQYLAAQTIDGSEVLEVGGGVGAVQIELLKSGVANTVNMELSSGYEKAAEELAREEGVEGRIERRLGDFVERQDEVDPADIVVLNRVVCCYPWMERMMDAAVGKTRRFLALSVPRGKWWVKSGLALGNGYMVARRCDFRSFVHPTEAIESAATGRGLEVRHIDNNLVWQAMVLERAA